MKQKTQKHRVSVKPKAESLKRLIKLVNFQIDQEKDYQEQEK